MAKVEYFSDVKNGSLQNNVRKLIQSDLRQFEGRRVHVVIEKIKSSRTLKQNAYLHSAFTIVTKGLNDFGNTYRMEEVKELLKTKFLLVDVYNEKTGECIGQRVKGTHELSTTEMNLFIDQIIEWSSGFGITVLYPNEQTIITLE